MGFCRHEDKCYLYNQKLGVNFTPGPSKGLDNPFEQLVLKKIRGIDKTSVKNGPLDGDSVRFTPVFGCTTTSSIAYA